MIKEQAVGLIGEDVYWLLDPVPVTVGLKTAFPSGKLTEVIEKITVDGAQVLVTAGFETHSVGNVYATFDDVKAALKTRYTMLRVTAQSDVAAYSKLITDCDLIVEPEAEPIPIG